MLYDRPHEYTRPDTTFHMDFAIAEKFGADAVRDTFKRAFKGWKNNVEYFTELVMCVNHRMWYWYNNGNEALSRIYEQFYLTANDYALEEFKGEALAHYINVTD